MGKKHLDKSSTKKFILQLIAVLAVLSVVLLVAINQQPLIKESPTNPPISQQPVQANAAAAKNSKPIAEPEKERFVIQPPLVGLDEVDRQVVDRMPRLRQSLPTPLSQFSLNESLPIYRQRILPYLGSLSKYQLPYNFYRAPFKFDVARLQEEILQFTANEWINHPNEYKGNTALIFLSTRGEDNHETLGPYLPTERLKKCPYISQVFATLQAVISRTRCMSLEGQEVVPKHVDVAPHWRKRVRVHVPIVTNDQVQFVAEDETVYMKEGECWVFDTARQHTVLNGSPKKRIHLVIDTLGTDEFWDAFESIIDKKAQKPWLKNEDQVKFIAYRPELGFIEPFFENFTDQAIWSVDQVENYLNYIRLRLCQEADCVEISEQGLFKLFESILQAWKEGFRSSPTQEAVKLASHMLRILQQIDQKIIEYFNDHRKYHRIGQTGVSVKGALFVMTRSMLN